MLEFRIVKAGIQILPSFGDTRGINKIRLNSRR